MTTSAWVLSVRKELRALLPALAASVVVVAAAPVVMGPRQYASTVLAAYVFGALAIGAISIGHEYTYRTLSLALTRPVSRRAVLGTKAFAVGLALTLLLIAVLVRLPQPAVWPESGVVQAALVLPLLGAVCVAPWLTMVCRSTLAGMVFTVAVPTMAALLTWSALVAKYGTGTLPAWAQVLPIQVLWAASIVLALVGVVTGWHRFMALEAIEGPGAAVGLPRWLARGQRARDTPTERRSVVWLLVAKELRLQQMSFVVAALFVAVYGALQLAPVDAVVTGSLPELAAGLYAVIFVLLVGALACAEEHRLGTVPWQVLLPVSARRQWAVKVAVVLTLNVVLGCALPVVLVGMADGWTRLDWNGEIIGLVILASCIALYLSSISKDGVRAVLLVPAVVAGAIPLGALVAPLGDLVYTVAMPYVDAVVGRWAPDGLSLATGRWLERIEHYGMWLFLGGVVLLLLRAAFQNYRTGHWNARRIVSQAAGLVACLAVALVLYGVLGAVQTDSVLRAVWSRCRQPGGVQCPAYIEDGPPFPNALQPSTVRRIANPR